MIKYFVSYSYVYPGTIGNGGFNESTYSRTGYTSGHANDMTWRDKPISSMDDITEIQEEINQEWLSRGGFKRCGVEWVTIQIISWQRFETE